MATILDTLKKGTDYLEKYGIEEARLSMEHLVAHVLKTDRMQLYLDFDRPLDEKALESLRGLTKRRSRGEPLQHLLGSVEFSDLEFLVDARALVPRPETEELVAHLLDRLEKTGSDPVSLVDVGSGSGVIGISLAVHRRDRLDRVVLADLSDDALSLARENAERLEIADAIEFVAGNLLDPVEGRFDLIVANLPYIPESEATRLSEEVRRDPPMALYGGERGTERIEELLGQSMARLEPGGLIALEFGIGQGDDLKVFAEDLGYDSVEVRRDLSGTDRFLFAVISA